MWQLLIVTFITGIFTKLADDLHDNSIVVPNALKLIPGVVYGSLIGYVIVFYPSVAPLWIGTVIGAVLSGKIDALVHYFAMSVMLLLIAVFGLSAVSLIPLILFAVVCTAEEMLHEVWITGKRIKNKALVVFVEFRPALEITALLYAVITGLWVVWLALLFFDIGYLIVGKIVEKFFKK